jgi:hypothetical protein
MANTITLDTYLTYEVAKAALPWLREAMDALELNPDDPGWAELFQVQLGLEHVVKQRKDDARE